MSPLESGAPRGDVDGLLAPGEEVNLTNCDREPIHIPGAIQPHGLLFTVTPTGAIAQLSASLAELVGRPADELAGGELAAALGEPAAVTVRETCERTEPPARPPVIALAGRRWELWVHRSDGLAVCELEPAAEADGPAIDGSAALEELEGVSEIARFAAEEIRRVAGYDRVMVYRFDGDGHGEVIAEAADDRLESFLGHHYPASDIPRQARALYLRQTVRMIVDVDYAPSPITPGDNPLTGAPLDLSLSRLRSVSPVHLEYLRNMGVTATLVVSVLDDAGELWGLIACHHYSPRYATGVVRGACLAIGERLAAAVSDQERREDRRRRADLEVLSRQLLRLLHNAPSASEGLHAGEKLLLAIADADGAAIVHAGERQTFGIVPGLDDERRIVALLPADGRPLVIDRLTRELPFVSHNTDMCGVLALGLGEQAGDYIIWYRDEWVHDLTWGGDPGDALRPDLTSMSLKSLSPRRSFEAWRQAVIGRSQPWQTAQVAVAAQLSAALPGYLPG